MASVFIYGTLCHLPLLELVSGDMPKISKDQITGFRATFSTDHSYPVLVPDADAVLPGLRLENLGASALLRLDYYEGLFGYKRQAHTLSSGEVAEIYMPPALETPTETPWDLTRWLPNWADLTLEMAREIMALEGCVAPGAITARWGRMRMEAGARIRGKATTRRGQFGHNDVTLTSTRHVHTGFFSTQALDLSVPQYLSDDRLEMTREVMLVGDVITLLPYDPVHDRVLVVEQFRAGPFLRNDPAPWTWEPVAGLIDPLESPEKAAIRECREETGQEIGKLIPIGAGYPSPGGLMEYHYNFIGLCDLSDDAPRVAGLVDEHEDIQSSIVDFSKAYAGIMSGQVNTMPLMFGLSWLALNRDRLRAGA
ncbi:MAG: NUDIX domain-containing protein [Halocynthiibacter sp.]